MIFFPFSFFPLLRRIYIIMADDPWAESSDDDAGEAGPVSVLWLCVCVYVYVGVMWWKRELFVVCCVFEVCAVRSKANVNN